MKNLYFFLIISLICIAEFLGIPSSASNNYGKSQDQQNEGRKVMFGRSVYSGRRNNRVNRPVARQGEPQVYNDEEASHNNGEPQHQLISHERQQPETDQPVINHQEEANEPHTPHKHKNQLEGGTPSLSHERHQNNEEAQSNEFNTNSAPHKIYRPQEGPPEPPQYSTYHGWAPETNDQNENFDYQSQPQNQQYEASMPNEDYGYQDTISHRRLPPHMESGRYHRPCHHQYGELMPFPPRAFTPPFYDGQMYPCGHSGSVHYPTQPIASQPIPSQMPYFPPSSYDNLVGWGTQEYPQNGMNQYPECNGLYSDCGYNCADYCPTRCCISRPFARRLYWK